MQTIRINPDDDARIYETVGQRINRELADGKHVTWLVCGGSNIPLIVKAMDLVDPSLTNNLTIMLTDERFGIPGHADSNWTQLDDAGFQPHQASVIRTLQPELTMEDTCNVYAQELLRATGEADIVIAHFGIGGDGHIAGILPGTEASRMDGDGDPLVTGYDGGAFMRVTMTPKAWQLLDVAYACAFGDTKHQAIERLISQDISVEDQPSQLLKRLDEAYLFTDAPVRADT